MYLNIYIYFFKYLFIYLWLCRVLVVAHGIFVAACGLLSCGRRALSCGVQDLVPQPGIEPWPPALGAWSLTHWTTRKVSEYIFKQ